jgi:putative ABC transport system substrate-binding protein
MNRRDTVLALLALAAPFALAQKPGQLPRIGLLWIHDAGNTSYLDAFRDGMRAQGYLDGKNVRIDDRFLVDRYEALAAAAARLTAEKVDVIVTYGTTAAQAARKATSHIPIVMVSSGDPVRSGVAASLARPGGNVTGFTSLSQDLSAKRLQILSEMLPSARRVAVLLSPLSQSEVDSLRILETTARTLNLELRAVEIRAPSELESAIAGIAGLNADASLVVGSSLFVAHRGRIATAFAKMRMPVIYGSQAFSEVGGLAVYGADIMTNFRRIAVYVDKILKGAKPADLPIEQPTRVELVINLKTAKALGIKIPQAVLVRADRVIE